jgi:hypothetical protein
MDMKIFANCAFFLTLAIMLGVMIYDEIVEWRATLKSKREAAEVADEKSDGQAENDKDMARRALDSE